MSGPTSWTARVVASSSAGRLREAISEGGGRSRRFLRSVARWSARLARLSLGSRTWDRRCHHSHGSAVPAAVVSRGGRLVGPSEALRRSPWERKRPRFGRSMHDLFPTGTSGSGFARSDSPRERSRHVSRRPRRLRSPQERDHHAQDHPLHFVSICVYSYVYLDPLGVTMLTVPNKTIYVSDGDLPLYQRAQELAGDNLSAAIAAALRRYVDVEEGRREGSTRSSSGSARARAARSASPASSSASGSTRRQPRRDLPRLPRPDGQVRPPRRAQPGLHDGRRRGQAGRLARLPRHRRTSATGPRPASRPSRSSRRSTSSASGSRRSSTTWSPAPPSSPPSRISTSDPSIRRDRAGGAA